MELGVCYYPEHWPPERWAADARQMREAGLSLVRLADFAWSMMEPEEGAFTWQWLDEAIAALAAEGLRVVLCTPTASPPPWISRAQPEILLVDEQGRRRRHGSRRHYCPNSPAYHEHTRRIVRAMAERYGTHPAVVAWQIDNEFGCHYTARCYCDACAAAFRRWLAARYGAIDALNQAWGNVFWSQVYNDWSEIEPPNLTVAGPNPSHALDYYRFASDSYVAYERMQFDILRPLVGDSLITTNYMSQFTDLDYYDLAQPLDRVTMSAYPTGHGEEAPALYWPGEAPTTLAFDVGDPYQTGFAHTLMRGFKGGRPFWVLEQQAGHVNWSVYNTVVRPGTARLWTWHALASGAEAVLYFRWRAGLLAQEQMHSGLLRHDGSPAAGYDDLLALEPERDRMAAISAAAPAAAEVALLLDYDSLWALQMQSHHPDYSLYRQLFQYYAALQRLGIPADVASADAGLSAYKLVIAPSAYMATGEQAGALARFAAAGGTVLLGARSGFKTTSNVVTDQPLPGVLRPLVGAAVTDWASLPPHVTFEVESAIDGLSGPVGLWMEALEPMRQPDGASARALVHYTSGPYAGRPSLTEMPVGRGRALYLAWYPTGAQAGALLAHLCAAAGIAPLAGLPEGVIAARRGEQLILLNFTDETRQAIVQGRPVAVGARDVRIVA